VLDAGRSVAISIRSFLTQGHGPPRAAAETGGSGMVTAALGKQCQRQKRLVMSRIEINSFVETLLGALSIAGCLVNRSHQIISTCCETLALKMALAGGNRLVEPSPVGEKCCLSQQ
jgi:hypothetical protein